MPVRRHENLVAATQPIRFYKFVALTFLFITVILSGVIMFMSSKRTSIVIETKSAPVDITDSVLVGDADKLGSVKGIVVSTEVTGEEKFIPTETEDREAQAVGKVVLYNDSGLTQPLVATTRLLSADGILFRLKERTVVPAMGSVEAAVYASEKGASGNIGPSDFTIPGLSATRQKEIYAKSAGKMEEGLVGVGILGKSDMDKAEAALRESLRKKAEEQLARENPGLGGVFKLVESEIMSENKVGDEVYQFVLTGTATVVGVFYEADALRAFAEKSLARKAVDDTEKIYPSSEPPTVKIEEYNVENNIATLQVFHSGLSKLNPESSQLEKSLFFGKNKDEIRRYLLRLDHIRSVNIKFTPAWIRTVPYVGDHVEIIVKEVN